MKEFKDHFPLMLDYDNFKYYRVDVNNLAEFEKLQGVIQQKAKQKKVISQEVIGRYFSLLKDIQTIEQSHYIPYIQDYTDKADKYFKGFKEFYFEREPRYWHNEHKWVKKPARIDKSVEVMYSYGFRDMVEWVIAQIFSVDKQIKESFTKEYCFFLIILTMLKFKNQLDALSKDGEAKMSNYKITAVAAYLAQLFGFPLSLYTIESNEGYFQAGKYYMQKVEKQYSNYFKKDVKGILSISSDQPGKKKSQADLEKILKEMLSSKNK